MENISEIVRWNNVAMRAATDKEAFTELYQHFFPRVYRYLLAKTANEDTADEVISNTFWKVYNHLSEYDMNKAAFSTWLYRIAENELKTYWRSQNRRADKESEWEDEFDPAAPDSDLPEQKILRTEQQNQIRRALEKLPERERKIIEMTYWLNYKPQRIAETLGLTPNNVSVILNRARAKLKTYLADSSR